MSLSKQILIFALPSEQQHIRQRLQFLTDAGYVLISQTEPSAWSDPVDVNVFRHCLCSDLFWRQYGKSEDVSESHLKQLFGHLIILGPSEASLAESLDFLDWQLTDSEATLKSLLKCQLHLYLSQISLLGYQRRQKARQYVLESLSHNMNGPMTPLMGLVENVPESGFEPEKRQHLMYAAVQRLWQQMACLHLLASFNEGTDALNPADIVLADLLLTLQAWLLPVFQSKEMAFIFEGSATEQWVRIDRAYFQRVLKGCLAAGAALALEQSEVHIQCHTLSLPRLQSRRQQTYAENQLFFDFFTPQTVFSFGVECLVSIQMPAGDDLTKHFAAFLQEGIGTDYSEQQVMFFLALDLLLQCAAKHQLCVSMETQINGAFRLGFVLPAISVSS